VVLLALVVFLCLLTVALAASGYLGMQAGQQARLERRAALADEHYRQGLARLDAGEYELAIAEFEYALQLVPDHPLAKQGLAEARARLATRPTPTSQATEEVARELFTQAKDGLRAGRLADGRPSPEPTARL
jgi:tetratricopeptide (TPR) repeat protein